MPVGTVTNNISDQIPLKSLPDAYVVVRRMTYGEELKRSAMSTRVLIGGDANSGKAVNGEVDVQTDKIAYWDFANLVVEHNITDEAGRTLNFKLQLDVDRLDSTIGKEIGEIIDDFNTVKDSPEVKNS